MKVDCGICFILLSCQCNASMISNYSLLHILRHLLFMSPHACTKHCDMVLCSTQTTLTQHQEYRNAHVRAQMGTLGKIGFRHMHTTAKTCIDPACKCLHTFWHILFVFSLHSKCVLQLLFSLFGAAVQELYRGQRLSIYCCRCFRLLSTSCPANPLCESH